MPQLSTHPIRFCLLVALATGCDRSAASGDPQANSGSGGQGSTMQGKTSDEVSGGSAGDNQNAGGSAITSGVGGAASSEGNNHASGGQAGSSAPRLNVLVFSRTMGYRHASIEPGIVALKALAERRGFSLTTTEDPSVFTATGLADYHVVLFLSTTGDVLDPGQQTALEAFVRSGRGYVGVHAASDTEYDWPWYGGLVGAYFRDHPPVQRATILIDDANHPSTSRLPTAWQRTDEWYAFRENPRAKVNVLMRLDESTYDPGTGSMGPDHPIAWYHEYDGGRAFYTGLGHTDESFQEAAFLDHLAGAIVWAAGM